MTEYTTRAVIEKLSEGEAINQNIPLMYQVPCNIMYTHF